MEMTPKPVRTFRVLGLLYLLIACGLVSCLVIEVEPRPIPQPRVLTFYSVLLPRVEVSTNPKKGVGLTYEFCGDVNAVGASWFYDWSTTSDCQGIEFVPMIWGKDTVCQPVSGTSQWLLGFNEPDHVGQAELTPYEAAVLWHLIERCYPDKLLVAPALAHNFPEWLLNFRAEYVSLYGQPPRLDALAAHCYINSAELCAEYVGAVIGLAEEWNIEGGVWVTEFSFWSTESITEAQTFIQWMDNEPGVARYAWFATRMVGDEGWPNTPLVQSGKLSFYGEMYR